jgi:hypothetical protein
VIRYVGWAHICWWLIYLNSRGVSGAYETQQYTPRVIGPVSPTGVSEIDALLDSGLPVADILALSDRALEVRSYDFH